jgi:hypothetical protein
MSGEARPWSDAGELNERIPLEAAMGISNQDRRQFLLFTDQGVHGRMENDRFGCRNHPSGPG